MQRTNIMQFLLATHVIGVGKSSQPTGCINGTGVAEYLNLFLTPYTTTSSQSEWAIRVNQHLFGNLSEDTTQCHCWHCGENIYNYAVRIGFFDALEQVLFEAIAEERADRAWLVDISIRYNVLPILVERILKKQIVRRLKKQHASEQIIKAYYRLLSDQAKRKGCLSREWLQQFGWRFPIIDSIRWGVSDHLPHCLDCQVETAVHFLGTPEKHDHLHDHLIVHERICQLLQEKEKRHSSG